MRALSATAKRAVFAQQTDEAFLFLLEISHASLAEPLRFTSDAVDTTHGGQAYVHYPFRIDLPADEDDGEIPQVTLTIDNVDRKITQTIRALTSPPTITLKVVLASSPDVVEVGPLEFVLKDVGYDALSVQGTLGYEEDFLNEPFPGGSFTPDKFPGLFR